MRTAIGISVLTTILVISICTGPPAIARQKYKTVMVKCYPKFADKKVNCSICHIDQEKKELNHYGIALRKELDETDVKDNAVIEKALRKLEDQSCKSGKWGERLERGESPCVCREVKPKKSVEPVRSHIPGSNSL